MTCRPLWAVLIAVSATVLTAGCSAGSKPVSASATTFPTLPVSTVPSPPAPSAVAREQALAAYRGMWEDMASAGRTSDSRSSLLSRHATGSALSQIVESIYANGKAGIVSKGGPVLHPRIVSLDLKRQPSRATISDCADASRWLQYDRATGKLKDKTPGGRHRITADVYGLNGVWKVVDFQLRAIGSC